MYQVVYSHSFNYRPFTYTAPDGQTYTTLRPALEVILRHGETEYSAIGLIDTGATFSLFSCQIGEYLGLPVLEGRPEQLRTLGGSLRVYAHTAELEIAYGWPLGRIEVLFSEEDISRNLLGRSDFLIQVQMGLWEQAGLIYLNPASSLAIS